MRTLGIITAVCMLLFSCKLMKKNNPDNSRTMTQQFAGKKTPLWVYSTNIYEVNVRQYTPEGTFQAFAAELPRLKEMGVETLWFMPITPIAQKKRKGVLGSYYACSDYTAVNPEFGTLDDFKALVRKAHDLKMKVILDWVANHTGWDHRWTVEHPDYYLKDSSTNDFKIASGMDDIIELDYGNPQLRRAMIDAMAFWVRECDIDGFRCDLAFWVELDFWKQARAELDALKPLFWFGEYDEANHPEYNEVFDASYTWTWMHASKDFYQKKQTVDSLLPILQKYQEKQPGVLKVWFTTNHDENSWNGTEYEKYGDMARALAVFTCTWNGIPLIYSGQELPNTKRLRFFEKDTIPWTGTYALHDFYKTLLQLRKNNPALSASEKDDAIMLLQTTEPSRILAYLRKKEQHEILVILHLSSQKNLRFELNDERIRGKFKNVFSRALNDFDAGKYFEMQPWEFLVYEKELNQ
ncbi:MAG: alpha-amylase family glycosyl hydrolase [Chitinophagaceae bacterium]|nr:alpha-amylase family glycosyl hydrolase [Chitinophagaceae bacterium]